MTFRRKWLVRALVIPVLASFAFAPAHAAADDHVVSAAEIQKRIVEHARGREANLRRVQEFFRSEPAARVLKSVPWIDGRIDQAVSRLDDQELARIAERADKARRDFAGGALTNLQLTYVVIALATAVIILVILEA
jgi:hypothetical protein